MVFHGDEVSPLLPNVLSSYGNLLLMCPYYFPKMCSCPVSFCYDLNTWNLVLLKIYSKNINCTCISNYHTLKM